MKKNIIVFTLLFLTLALCLFEKQVEAVSFSFAGATYITDPNLNGFSELISFDTQTIFNSDPEDDNILYNNVEISNLTLAGTWSTIGNMTLFDFNPTYYASGFRVQNGSSTDLLIADLEALTLTTNAGEGTVNSELLINLFNINVTTAGLALGSDVLDAFNSSSIGGILTLTLQYNGNLATAINAGTSVTTIGSGTASVSVPEPATTTTASVPVPEPATLLLLGAGLVVLAGVKRIKRG
ncbi:MAG: hypothetical protein A3C43_09600 [Candidatus Schekmanbacteria bacterium RIFCSPHIGHO2_02_FULL_38_11]|uniref:Ice-binding protein C-terminal domain-containing protein n=1 Tax=Candidatus Schekmanbacteria bacterium RIFCSPLOWO2_12_FULL_38_15 TaxID=1817883 RepID=A0A1F7SK92_9BACT|nr:MAG: hypothetical protein A2043_10240 [Candidatus Schekmanbacteria bacterium GWA2_38_9]OGL49445.1 MAG: hypothetical protein A3H37_10070 [Candidatus Schekmanbacteria bacterium RIFCSPLOWO2_02_FULL_38_14]OGL53637.1 MAG: hypothetical protein A3G31_04980 [Candidatus Schekmanbacteria bacterium RIFCSPLOWO2_12_FULL_38_15]OGL55565.1 MAG: hypothetical protein A3C43_09600 [Candidatus Schekmanbacteria bacterium RIFCSPHIGHO2_02_FULL_38_11]